MTIAMPAFTRAKNGDWYSRKVIPSDALDLPTSWQLATANADDFTARMAEAINGMLLDMLAAIARKDYEDRRRRQAQGIAKAKAEGAYRGRAEDTKRNAAIIAMLRSGQSWNTII